MELVDRYLQAVKFWLPKGQKLDIVAELSEDIRSQIEERETVLGRKLNEAEVEAILKQLGRPILVAGRYSPQEYLIGPVLFPIYRFVLKVLALCYLVPWVLVWIGLMSLDPGYRYQHSGGSLIGALGSLWGALWIAALTTVGVVTIIFAVLERTQAKSRLLEDWDPRKLPPVRDPKRIARGSSVVEMAANAVFCVWWVQLASPLVLGPSTVTITLSPVWHYFFWGFLLLALFNLAASSANLFRPYWTPVRAAIRLATDLAGSALFCWLMKSAILAGIASPSLSPEQARQLVFTFNLWMSRTMPIMLIFAAVIAVFDVYRIIRAGTPDAVTPRAAAGGWTQSALS